MHGPCGEGCQGGLSAALLDLSESGKGRETMAYDEIIRRRCSIRKYAEKPVEEEKLNAVLEAGRIAHAGANKQLVRVYALTSDEALAKVRSLRRAPSMHRSCFW